MTSAIALAGCDVFLTSKAGRWNPDDPKNELVRASVVLTPEVDGFVHGTGSVTNSRVFEDTLLRYDYWSDKGATGECYTLMSFDLGPIPSGVVIDSASLTLQFSFVSKGGDIDFRRVAQAWDPTTVEFAWVESPGFVEGSGLYVALTAAGPLTVDVTEIVHEWRLGSPNHGLRIRAWAGSADIRSHASEQGTMGPRLEIAYRAIPE